MREMVSSYYTTIFPHQAWNSFDQHVFVSPVLYKFADKPENEYSTLLNFVEKLCIRLSNVQYLHIYPSRLVMPVRTIYSKHQPGIVVTNYTIQGQIGQNVSPHQILEHLQTLSQQLSKYDNSVKQAYKYDNDQAILPTLIVLFKNDFKFPHMSQIVLVEVVLHGEEMQPEISSMPLQSVMKFSAREMRMIDIPLSVAQRYNLLYQAVS